MVNVLTDFCFPYVWDSRNRLHAKYNNEFSEILWFCFLFQPLALLPMECLAVMKNMILPTCCCCTGMKKETTSWKLQRKIGVVNTVFPPKKQLNIFYTKQLEAEKSIVAKSASFAKTCRVFYELKKMLFTYSTMHIF